MNGKLRTLFAFALISFFSLSGMKEDNDLDHQLSVKRKKEEITAEDTYPLWLYKKASQSSGSDTLSRESLEFLQKYMPEEAQQEIADILYKDIDPHFMATLLCNNLEPEQVVTHSHPPYVTYPKPNEAMISCNHSPYCQVARTFPIAGREYIQSYQYPLCKKTYHPWKIIHRSSAYHRIAPPRFMLKEANNNLISVHTDHTVYKWDYQQFEDAKKACAPLSLKTVILLQYMQQTHAPIEENESIQVEREELPRKLRSKERAKKQKVTPEEAL